MQGCFRVFSHLMRTFRCLVEEMVKHLIRRCYPWPCWGICSILRKVPNYLSEIQMSMNWYEFLKNIWPQRFSIGKLKFVLKWLFCSKDQNYMWCHSGEGGKVKPRRLFARSSQEMSFCQSHQNKSGWEGDRVVQNWHSCICLTPVTASGGHGILQMIIFRSMYMNIYCVGFWGGEPWWFETAVKCSCLRNLVILSDLAGSSPGRGWLSAVSFLLISSCCHLAKSFDLWASFLSFKCRWCE